MMNPQDTNWPSPAAGSPQVPVGVEEGATGPDENDPYFADSKAMMDQLGQAKDKADSLLAQGDNETESARVDALRSIFLALQDQGVDLSDPASVAEYRDKLQKRNPDLLAMFDQMMSMLLGEESQPEGVEGLPPPEGTPPEEALSETTPPEGMPEGAAGLPQMNIPNPNVQPASQQNFPQIQGLA